MHFMVSNHVCIHDVALYACFTNEKVASDHLYQRGFHVRYQDLFVCLVRKTHALRPVLPSWIL